MCLSAVGVRAGGIGSPDVVDDANFFPVRGADSVVGSLCPRRFSVCKFCWRVPVAVMLADGMVQFTAEDAAELVTWRSAAVRKWLVVNGGPSTAGRRTKTVSAGWYVLEGYRGSLLSSYK